MKANLPKNERTRIEALQLYQELAVELTLSDRNVDIIEDGVDVAVRIGPLPDSSFAAVQLGRTQRVVVASPTYLRKKHAPQKLEDLSNHNCLRFTALSAGRDWHFERGGHNISVAISSTFSFNSGDAVIQTALEGGGLAAVLYYQVMAHIASGKLQLVLQEFAPAPVPIHAVFAHPKLFSAKVRAFVDYLKSSFVRLSFLPDEKKISRTRRAQKTVRR